MGIVPSRWQGGRRRCDPTRSDLPGSGRAPVGHRRQPEYRERQPALEADDVVAVARPRGYAPSSAGSAKNDWRCAVATSWRPYTVVKASLSRTVMRALAGRAWRGPCTAVVASAPGATHDRQGHRNTRKPAGRADELHRPTPPAPGGQVCPDRRAHRDPCRSGWGRQDPLGPTVRDRPAARACRTARGWSSSPAFGIQSSSPRRS